MKTSHEVPKTPLLVISKSFEVKLDVVVLKSIVAQEFALRTTYCGEMNRTFNEEITASKLLCLTFNVDLAFQKRCFLSF